MKRRFLSLSLATVSIFLTLVAVEIGLRIVGYGDWLPVIDVDDQADRAISSGWMREDRQLLWRIRECDRYCESIRHVHPDNPRAARSPKTRKRIICLGDSCTFFSGTGMPAYSRGLESLFGRSGGVEVLNAAVPGYSSTQGLSWLRSELLAYEPDLVTVYFGWNDHWLAHSVPDDLYVQSLEMSSLRLVRLGKALVKTIDAGKKGDGEKPRRVPLNKYDHNLREIHRLLAASEAECVFLTAPGVYAPRAREDLLANHLIDEEADYMDWHRQYNDVVRGLADEGCGVLDLEALFKKHPDPTTLMMQDGIHLSDEGLARVARELHEYIVTNDLLK